QAAEPAAEQQDVQPCEHCQPPPTALRRAPQRYAEGDERRDAGFSIFYMGINIGAFIANFLAAIMRNAFFWEAIFIAAGIGMLISIIILLASWKVLERADPPPKTNPEDTPFSEIMGKILGPALVIGVSGWAVANYWLPESMTKLVKPTDFGFLLGSIPILLFFARLSNKAAEDEKPGLRALLPIYLAGGTFFMVLHLNGSAMTTWANDNTTRQLGQNDPIVMIADAVKVGGETVFAGNAYPNYYANAADDIPRPNKSTLLSIASEDEEKMFGQKKMGEADLTVLTAKLPPDVRVEVLPIGGELSDEQKKWKKFSIDIFAKVNLESGTDSHGVKTVSVKVDGGTDATRRVAFVRTAGDQQYATYLVTKTKFDKLYEGDPPQIEEGGVYLKTANPELYQSWNAFFVVLFTPFIMLFFGRLLKQGVDFSTARKILAGMVITG
ncbi:MAG TPA: MFS transporter, partial [Planctomycetes bacterium]|nr:MFS transporter [Planctomycetota bacterium]